MLGAWSSGPASWNIDGDMDGGFRWTSTWPRIVAGHRCGGGLSHPVCPSQLIGTLLSWCQPCRVLTPLLKSVTGPESGFDLVTIDVDQHPEVAGEYKVGPPSSVNSHPMRLSCRHDSHSPLLSLRRFRDSSLSCAMDRFMGAKNNDRSRHCPPSSLSRTAR